MTFTKTLALRLITLVGLVGLVGAITAPGLAGVAAAQPAPTSGRAAAAPAAGGTPAPRVKNYEFDADEIDGELVRPDDTQILARLFAKHGKLIRPRTNFLPEIVKSAEDI